MNICSKCGVHVATNITFCPLCGAYIERKDTSKSPTAYAMTRLFNSKKKVLTFLNKILLIAFILLSLAAGVDVLLGSVRFRLWWYIIAAASVLFVKLAILNTIKKNAYNWRYTVISCFYLFVYIVFLDWYLTIFNSFSFSFVLPGVLIAGVVTLTIFTLNQTINPLAFLQAFAITIIFNALLIVFNVLLWYFGILAINIYLSLIAFVVMIICLVLVLFFRYKDFKIVFVAGK